MRLPKNISMQLNKIVHWFKAVLVLEAGVLLVSYLLSETANPQLDRPAYAWFIVISVFVGFMPLYLRKKYLFQLRALLTVIAIGVLGALLTRYWETETGPFVPLVMILGLSIFKAKERPADAV